VTFAALVSSVGGAIAIGTGDRLCFVVGVMLAFLGFWLDHVDGQVARWHGSASLDGVYLDYLMHHTVNQVLGFSLGYGLAARFRDPRWSIAGFAIAAGWILLSLHNDCRYKAFFQRLKSTTRTFRIDGGSGGRPEPASPWPRRGRAVLTYPAYKLCETHIILIGLAGLSILAVINPVLWLGLWRSGVCAMAVLAPLLALGRTGHSLAVGTVENEFVNWFQPEMPTQSCAPCDRSNEDCPATAMTQDATE
jgi:hypothetical protein